MSVFSDLHPPYGTIVADPPWSYRTSHQITTAKTKKPDAEANYSTMTMREVAALSWGHGYEAAS